MIDLIAFSDDIIAAFIYKTMAIHCFYLIIKIK